MNLFSLKVLAAIAFSLAQGSAVPVDGLTKRAPKVVGLDFEIHYDTRGNTTIDKRVVSTPLINENQYYITYLLFGSDQQKIGVDIDSGSSDLWIPNTQASGAVTSYGVYDSSTSSSAQDTGKSFTIEYGVPGDSTGSYGEFFTDTIAFSDGSSPIQNFQFGSVYQTSVGQSGILGLGLESLEAPNQDGYGSEYPNFPVALKNAGYIDVVGYSLYLNTPTATGGTLLFGGKDLAKIDGDLVTLPHSGDSARLDVTVDSVTIGGSTTSIGSPYNLDSGTTFTITSPDAFNALVSYVGGIVVVLYKICFQLPHVMRLVQLLTILQVLVLMFQLPILLSQMAVNVFYLLLKVQILRSIF